MSSARRPLISVVSPVFNEADNVETLIARLRRVAAAEPAFDWEFIFVDDGSDDRTAEVICRVRDEDSRVKLIQLTRNFGHQVALTAGLREAAGAAVISLDGDMQHPPEVLPRFLRRYESGSDIVVGVRKSTNAGWLKRFTSGRFYWLINKVSSVPIQADGADFRLMSRRAVDGLLRMPERSRFLRGLVSWMGYEIDVVRYDEDARVNGKSKFSLLRMLYFAADAITSFSALPLRVAMLAGVAISFSGLLYALYIAAVYIFRPGVIVPGWTSIMLLVLWMGGLQLIVLGVIGEYLHRIFDEVKNRPLYLVRRKVGFDAAAARDAEGSASEASDSPLVFSPRRSTRS